MTEQHLTHEYTTYMYNFRTGAYEPKPLLSDENALDYLPQNAAAQGIYKVQRLLGMSVLEAMDDVLSKCLPA